MKENVEQVLEAIQNRPATEFITLIEQEGSHTRCAFCGRDLEMRAVGWGRERTYQAESCGCRFAGAAEAHNSKVLQARKEQETLFENKRAKALQAKRDEIEQAPVKVNYLELISIASGRTVSDLPYGLTLEKFEDALRNEDGTTVQEKLFNYARKNNFENALRVAANEYAENVETLRKRGILVTPDISHEIAKDILYMGTLPIAMKIG